jgi:hypothetical protein
MSSEKKPYKIINIDLKTFNDSVLNQDREVLSMNNKRELFKQIIEDMDTIIGKKTLVRYKGKVWEAKAGADVILVEVKLDLEK